MNNVRNFLSEYLMPSYGELTVFLMAVVFILLLSSDGTLRSDIFEFPSSWRFDFRAFIYFVFFMAIFVGGLALSLYHVFTTRPKNSTEKLMMLVFAGTTNGVAGAFAGIHILDSTSGAWLIFPIGNILSSMSIIYLLALSDESRFHDTDTTRPQLIVGIAVTLILFAVCRFVFDLYWAITFSIGIAYVTINPAIKSGSYRGILAIGDQGSECRTSENITYEKSKASSRKTGGNRGRSPRKSFGWPRVGAVTLDYNGGGIYSVLV